MNGFSLDRNDTRLARMWLKFFSFLFVVVVFIAIEMTIRARARPLRIQNACYMPQLRGTCQRQRINVHMNHNEQKNEQIIVVVFSSLRTMAIPAMQPC
ncbi:hypothetical protein [Rugamonas apoptosis]|uniref:Uncharacterized protein n=1 Tax=Rugamonas apoptosis TaxID=2758570 RepID=A0A7W2F913_9BURK|nr:hypothetical protein [Rugamonas apoptosis]MBA5687312.1 hypothetical protein [Rugamonas apoptosis]